MSTQEKDYGFSKKWSRETEANGYTQVPNILLTCQGSLGLKHSELVTLLQLISYWFIHKGEVYPSITTIAERSNKGYSTTHRHLKSLEDKGYIKRKHRYGNSNKYDLKPCAVILHQHQRSCNLCLKNARKRGIRIHKVSRVPSSKTIRKEDQLKRLNNNTQIFSGPTRVSSLLTQHSIGKSL